MESKSQSKRRLKERGLTLLATGRFGSRQDAEMEARNEREREIAAKEKRDAEKQPYVINSWELPTTA